MRRMIIVFALSAGLPPFWQPLWGDAPGVRKDIAENPRQKADLNTSQPQIGTKASPFIVETHPRPESEAEAAKARTDKEHASRVERWMLVFTGAAALFTGLLVIVGGCGVYAAIRTLLAINRQAYLMERQTVVMESQTKAIEAQLKLAMMQWVSVKEWKVELLEPSGTVPQPKQLLINFDIANESNFPLKMNATFRFGIHQAMTRAYDTGPVLLLPRHPHKATLSLPLTPYDYKCYGEQAILISVTGEIAHVGILKQEGPFMTINGELLCGKTATTSFEFETMTLTPRDEAGEQEPQKAS